MKRLPSRTLRAAALATLSLAPFVAAAQTGTQPAFETTPAILLDGNPLAIRRPAQPNQPFSVTGERGAILGQQDGSFELWLLPVKLLRDVHLTARLKDYDAAIDLNAQAATIEVRPDHTTITYAHAAITVKQHMFVPQDSEPGVTNAVVLFEIHATRPAELTLSFTPSMERMWPAPNSGRPGGGWTAVGSGGAYTLETDNPGFFGVVAMPNSTSGELRPYQERPLTTPMSFRLHYDPAGDEGRFYPLLCGVSDGAAAGGEAHAALLAKVLAQGDRISALYHGTAESFAHFFDTRLTVTTPDRRFDDAMRWAEIAIETNKVASPHGAGLAGGWFTSGDSARPGFGWFFGRDSLWTLYAIDSYGDFALAREAMDFLFNHQRADGKMMHEVSQTADLVDWAHLPYLYASADSTPLAVMQMEDYVRASGDVAYLRAHWDAIKRAYAFTRAHTTAGVYDNTQGTGWVEEWFENGKPGLPHQEIYLAALDAQSSQSMERLAHLMGDEPLAAQAAGAEATITPVLASYRAADGTYRFSRNADGSFEETASVFPSVAWWSGRLALPDAGPQLAAWAGHRFLTDWGIRSVPTDGATYEPISYHRGSVWPLYTGWAALAEYRAGRPLSAYANLRANTDLTWLQDPGDVTEVLSGAFYQPLGRSSSHQLWSSAMVLSPAIRGLFGLEADALRQTLHVAPQLPAAWDHAELHNVPVGDLRVTVTMRRADSNLDVDASTAAPATLCLEGASFFTSTAPCRAKPELHHRLSVPLPAVEVGLPEETPQPGAATAQLKVLDQIVDGRSLVLKMEAEGGSTHALFLRRNGAAARTVTAEGATVESGGTGEQLVIRFDPGQGYVAKSVRLHW